jgi:hypothetical protein
MSYVLLILERHEYRDQRTREEGHGSYRRMLDYAESLRARGVLLASNSLRSAAARLNLQRGEPSVVDGPFTESKEMIGGFFLLDCSTRAQALQLAAECPAAEWATIEVRETGSCYE